MNLLLKSPNVFQNGEFVKRDILIEDGKITAIEPNLSFSDNFSGHIVRYDRFFISKGFADIHVHFREPGYSYKATIKQESKAATAGGFTAVATMPNLNPHPDTLVHLQEELDLINRDASIKVLPYGTITLQSQGKELSELKKMSPYVAGFSDDGVGVENDELMLKAFEIAKELNLPITSHCEFPDEKPGVIHDGLFAKQHNLPGISSKSEWSMVKRDIELVRQTGCRYNVCHVSTKESVDLIRQAKKEGLPVSGEAAPHYLIMNDMDLQDLGRFKMNPPIRSKEDQAAIREAFLDGTLEILATDHAPHSAKEKSQGLLNSNFGIVGLETAFALINTEFVQTGLLSLETLMQRMVVAPRQFLKLETELKVGQKADFVVFDPEAEYQINSENFLSLGKATPFEEKKVKGKILYTFYDGELVYRNNNL